jgi:hypothetical protein
LQVLRHGFSTLAPKDNCIHKTTIILVAIYYKIKANAKRVNKLSRFTL